ncbi:MAG: MBL fold metallo-hydrolase [Proteobacteria bacterium]|nr:MBL fold metallo-hydrolase [Pseudomonadota bacterium]
MIRSALLVLLLPSAAPAQPAPDEWFHIVPIDRQTYAISEPRYWQQNVSYLLIGSSKAVLFDSGSGTYNMRPTVERLANVPVIAIPSHLHFDHVGNIREFTRIGLLHNAGLLGQVHNGEFQETQEQLLLRNDGRKFSFRVTDWLRDGQRIDLGGRSILFVSTPGHTPDSVSLVEPASARAFTGDLVNRVAIGAFSEGADLGQTLRSLRKIRMLLGPTGGVFEGHSEQFVRRGELDSMQVGIEQVLRGKITPTDVCISGQRMLEYDFAPFSVLSAPPDGPPLRPLPSRERAAETHVSCTMRSGNTIP